MKKLMLMFFLSVVSAVSYAAELLPFPAPSPGTSKQFSQGYVDPASVYARQYDEFNKRIAGLDCNNLDDLQIKLRREFSNAGADKKQYYSGLIKATLAQSLNKNCPH